MTKRVWLLVSLVVACFGLLGAAVLTRTEVYSLFQQDLEHNRKQCATEGSAEQAEHTKDCQSFLYRTLEDPVAAFTAGLFVATGALFIATFGLYAAAIRQGADAKEAVEITRQTAKTQLRAYLSVEKAVFTPVRGTSDLKLSVIVRNFGQTPAYKVQTCIQLYYGPSSASPYEDLSEFGSMSILGPSASIEMFSTYALDESKLARVFNETSRVFTAGHIKYEDAFGESRFFAFKARSGPPEATMIADGKAALSHFPVVPAVNGYQAN